MILIIACGSCIAIFYPKQAPNPANTNAQKAYDSGDWATAARLANQQLRTDRADQEAVRILARSSAREGRDDIATSLYENRLGLRAMQAEDHFLLGRIIAGQGNSDLALGIWEKLSRQILTMQKCWNHLHACRLRKCILKKLLQPYPDWPAGPALRPKASCFKGFLSR